MADQVKDGSLPALPYVKYRFPAVATLFVALSVGVYFVSSGSTQLGFFKDGKLESAWDYFNEEGVRYRRGTFVNAFKNGEWTDYHPNGQVAAIDENGGIPVR